MSAPRPDDREPGREVAADRPAGWSPADEEWLRRNLAAAPPLTEWQRDRLRELLDLSGQEPGRDRPATGPGKQ